MSKVISGNMSKKTFLTLFFCLFLATFLFGKNNEKTRLIQNEYFNISIPSFHKEVIDSLFIVDNGGHSSLIYVFYYKKDIKILIQCDIEVSEKHYSEEYNRRYIIPLPLEPTHEYLKRHFYSYGKGWDGRSINTYAETWQFYNGNNVLSVSFSIPYKPGVPNNNSFYILFSDIIDSIIIK